MSAPTTATVDTPLGRVSYAEQGGGAPLVLLHSLLTDRRAFDHVMPDLPGRVIAMDLPGFGETTLTGPSIDEYAASMNAAVSEVSDGDGAVTVMGNGLGSFVALAMAMSHESKVDRLALVGCGLAFPEGAKQAFAGMVETVESGGMAAVTPTALRRIFTEEYLAGHPEQVEARTKVLTGTDPRAFVTACRALATMDLTGRAGRVAVPTLIVVGEEDQATPPVMAQELHAALSDSRLLILEGVGHAPQIQDPPAFVNSVRDFLEGG